MEDEPFSDSAGKAPTERDEQEGKSHRNEEAKPPRGRPRKSSMEEFNYPVQPRTVHVVKKPRTVVNHSYRDFSCVPPLLTDGAPIAMDEMTFSQKLHEIVSTKEYMYYIGWMPHGRAFRVHIPKRFERVVAPKYFGHSRYSSFLRQLNNFGFKHITKGPDRNCYYHECFLRGLTHLCKYMPKPKNARRLIPDPDNEPNFYQISESFPLSEEQQFTRATEAISAEQSEQQDSKPAAKTSSAAKLNPSTMNFSTSVGNVHISENHLRYLEQQDQVPEELLRADQYRRGGLSSVADPCARTGVSDLSAAYQIAPMPPASLPSFASIQAFRQRHASTQSATLEDSAIVAAAAGRLNPVSASLGLSSPLLRGLPPSVLATLLAARKGGPKQEDLPSKHLKNPNSDFHHF